VLVLALTPLFSLALHLSGDYQKHQGNFITAPHSYTNYFRQTTEATRQRPCLLTSNQLKSFAIK